MLRTANQPWMFRGCLVALFCASCSMAQAWIPETRLGQPTLRAGLNLLHHFPSYDTVEDLSDGGYLAGVSLSMPLQKFSSQWSPNIAVGVRADWLYHDATFRDTVQLPDGTTYQRHTSAQFQSLRLYPELSYNFNLNSTSALQLGVYIGMGHDLYTGTRTNVATGAPVDDNPLPVDLGEFTSSTWGTRVTYFYKDWGVELSVAPRILGISLVIR